MDIVIPLNPHQVVDLLFRFAAVGVLLSLLLSNPVGTMPKRVYSYGFVIICCIAYLLLTAPIANHHYGWLRPPLLLLTDLTPLALINLYWLQTRSQPIFFSTPKWLRVFIIAWLFWLSYFFLIEAGRGIYHDIHHALGLAILVFILIDAAKGLKDDLVEKRRRLRLVMIAAISFYMALLTLVEFSPTNLKDHWLFSLLNSFTALLVSAYFLRRYLQITQVSSIDRSSIREHANTQSIAPGALKHPLIAELTEMMDRGFYTQNGLSISQLASELNVPAHQLRKVINSQMGFDNFSQFVNSYRIPAVCEALTDPARTGESILTIALEAGFNSIAPFNRAFKHKTGMTPSEYRERFQK